MSYDFVNGETLLVNKPIGWTSFDVVNKLRYTIKKSLEIKKIKVGHAGTLDPLATGLLIVCTGKNTKKIADLQDVDKEYTGIITLGATTPSFDLETEIDNEYDISQITEKHILEAVKKLSGTIQQMPPIYSAKKVAGKKSYDAARAGETFQLKPVSVTIHSFEIEKIDLPDIYFKINCSKGTYIRSIAYDLGRLLNNGGYLKSLCRTRVGNYTLNNAKEIKDLTEAIKINSKNQLTVP